MFSLRDENESFAVVNNRAAFRMTAKDTRRIRESFFSYFIHVENGLKTAMVMSVLVSDK